ncbi:MAG: hypothetical protein AUH72_16575 [Acidobacteria bacterium 13_1_40CM_4_65_8]|nr:MAG: hypothetical protein AUH72_16575 [Acidobacteria bacterium 13_1_40CM_4_65_8]
MNVSSGPETTPASSAASACGILNVDAGETRTPHAADGLRRTCPTPISKRRKHSCTDLAALGPRCEIDSGRL